MSSFASALRPARNIVQRVCPRGSTLHVSSKAPLATKFNAVPLRQDIVDRQEGTEDSYEQLGGQHSFTSLTAPISAIAFVGFTAGILKVLLGK